MGRYEFALGVMADVSQTELCSSSFLSSHDGKALWTTHLYPSTASTSGPILNSA